MQAKWIFTAAAATLLVGCATPMEELMLEANQTGDWSAVERRMASQARREAEEQSRRNPCPSGQTGVTGCSRDGERLGAFAIPVLLVEHQPQPDRSFRAGCVDRTPVL